MQQRNEGGSFRYEFDLKCEFFGTPMDVLYTMHFEVNDGNCLRLGTSGACETV